MEAPALDPLAHLLLQAGILLFCSFVQSAVGFAFSLFSNALLLQAGLALPETVVLSTLASTLQRLLMTIRLHLHVVWRHTLPMSGICLLTLPLGILILKLLSRQSLPTVKAGVGMLILAILLVQAAWKVRPQERLHRGWGILAAATSGLLTGLANIGGPPLLLWVHAHDWPNERTRVTVMAITTVLVPMQMLLMFGTFGSTVFPSASQFLMLIPAVALGTAAGMAAGRRLSKPRLRLAALGLLAIVCLVSILEPLFAKTGNQPAIHPAPPPPTKTSACQPSTTAKLTSQLGTHMLPSPAKA